MKNFRHEGRLIPCTAPAGGVASSEGVKIGDLFGVAATTAPEGGDFELALEGVFTLPKAAGAIGQGAKVYWNAGNANVTTTASGNMLIGHAVAAALDGSPVVDVRLSN